MSRPSLLRPRAYRYRPRRRRAGEASRMGAFDMLASRGPACAAPVSRAQLAYAAANVEWFKDRSRARRARARTHEVSAIGISISVPVERLA